jgi:hypothetical protein
MKRLNRLFPLIAAAVMVVSACGSMATPTTDPADVQNTAIAAASTAVVEMQTATLILTPVPPTVAPTQTPVPTDTPVILATETSSEIPTLEAAVTTTATAAGGANSDCVKPLQGLSGGKPAKIKIENNSGFPITVSLFLNKNAFGDCGYRGYALPKGGSILITDLIQGCYSASAIINNPNKPGSAFGYGCINNPDKWSFIVSKDSVSLQGR